MNIGSKFDALSSAINENASYKLNEKGMQLIKNYHSIILQLEKSLTPFMKLITKDPVKIAKQLALQSMSIINSSKEGNETFDLMARLDTLTNGGKTPIDGGAVTFNQNDKILQCLEKI